MWFASSKNRRQGRQRSAFLARRPRVEMLEDRCLLSSPGSLDTTFGSGGTVTTSISGQSLAGASAVTVQSDNKIVVAGWGASGGMNLTYYLDVARYNANGTLDTSFGKKGYVTSQISGGEDGKMGILVQPDGKIVVGGGTGTNFELIRYTSNGSLDTSFGSGGIVTTSFGSGLLSQVHGLAIEIVNGNADIVAVGVARDANYNGQYAVARYNPNGSLDSSFGASGEVLIPVVGGYQALAVLVQPLDQKIIVGGDGGVALVRLTTSGQLDSSFGAGGIAQPGIGNEANALAFDSNGNVVVAGDGWDPTAGKEDFLVARFGTGTSSVPAGSLDTTFGGGQGYVLTHISTQHAYARGVAIQNNGLIVAAGAANYTVGTTIPTSALACYTASGSLDSSFGSGGVLYPTFGGGSGAVGEQGDYAVTIQPTSSTSYRIVAVSSVVTKTGASFGVAAYVPDSTVQPVLEASAPQHPVQQTLTWHQLQPVVQTAIADWQAAGASPAQVALLKHVPISISPPPPGYLGGEANYQIWISPNADGWGWYTGVSQPGTAVPPGQQAGTAVPPGQMDLLSVVTHEFGHVLGLGDTDNLQDVMGLTLAAGVRRLPTRGDVLETGVQPTADVQDAAALLVQVLSERLHASVTPVAYAPGSPGVVVAPGASQGPAAVEPSRGNSAAPVMQHSMGKSTAVVDQLFALNEMKPLEDIVE